MKRRFLLIIVYAICLFAPAMTLARSITEPNDPNYPDQWALAQVGASCAWGITIGSPSVTVAVVDSGVDMNHPDLVDRLRDDGRDFVDGDNDPSDENGHGTNVAGIIAQTLDNNEGGVGLAPGIKILPIRVMNAKGAGSDRSIARGIRYAADRGAQVINLSLGATLTIDADTVSEQVTSAISYAQDKGALVIVAAGNDFLPLENAIVGDNTDVLVVAATDEDDIKANFSNSGPWIGITAPGVHILSTMPTYDVYLTRDVPRDERFQKNYDYMSGTSQATPLVSALAALLFSAHPDWDAHRVEQTIKDRAADISQQNATLWQEGFLGSGRMDACAALSDSQASAPTAGNNAQVDTTPTPESGGIAGFATPTTNAARTPVPTAVNIRKTPVPVASGVSSSLISSSLIIFVGVLGCGAVVLFAIMLFAIVRVTRKPRQQPTAAPIYTPIQSSNMPIPQAIRTPAASVDYTMPAIWGRLQIIGGPVQPRSFELSGSGALIGRSDECAITIVGDGTISRRHALIRNNGYQQTIEDAGSSHGTYLRGQRISTPIILQRGDVIQIGQTVLRFE